MKPQIPNRVRRVRYSNKVYEVEYMSPREAGIRAQEARHSFQELPLLRRIASLWLDGTYIDIGANVGNHSVFFNHHTKAEEIWAFEPHPVTFRTLQRNLTHNKCDRVRARNMALWDKAGILHMDDLPPLNAGRAQIVEVGGKFAKKKKFTVWGRTLDSLFKWAYEGTRPYWKVSLIKIDAEDSEPRILRGARKVIGSQLPVIVAEHHNERYLQECKEVLDEFGYKVSDERFEPRGETRLWLPKRLQ